MKIHLVLFPLSLLSILVACGPQEQPASPASAPHDHEAPGPHGGEMVVIGNHVAHLEIVHDRAQSQLILYPLGEDGKTALPMPTPPRFNMSIDGQGVQVVGEPKDGGYVLSHPSFSTDPDGHLAVELDGKQFQLHLHAPGHH